MDIQLLLVACLGIFIGFFVQTMVGFAGALVALPILLLKMELPEAVAYLAIFYFFSSLFLVKKEWNNIDRDMIWRLTIPTLVGVALGIFILSYGKPIFLKRALGVFVIAYVAYTFFNKNNVKISPKVGFPVGFFGGLFSGIFSTGGPVYMMYVNSSLSDIQAKRATMIGILGLISFVRIPLLSVNHLITMQQLKYALFIFPVFLLGQRFGKQAFEKLNVNSFRNILLILLMLSGVSLLIKG